MFIISTENINHNFKPVPFFCFLGRKYLSSCFDVQKLGEFLSLNFNFKFQPQFVMIDNCDALITACKEVFQHNFTHMGYQFHIAKRMKEKTASKDLKDKKKSYFLV